MNVTLFCARADIVGRRIRIVWEFVPAAGESIADIPPVSLRRKLRDFAYPAPALPDPYLVYDSSNFPPAPVPGVLTVTDLDGWESLCNGERQVFAPISVAVATGGRFVEVLRRTVISIFDLNGAALRQRVEIIDTGMLPGALQPSATYYYQLFGATLPAGGDDAAPYRDTAMATDSYGQNRVLYQSLPEIYRRHDVVTRPFAPGQDSVPELAPAFGQLRRFVDPFGIAVDSLRGTAEGLTTLHDVDAVEARYLPLIAQWIGWDLSVDADIPLRRNELKTASRLYALVGTLPGLRALVTQFTGWFTQVAEFAQNIAQSNQPPRRNLFAIAQDAGTGLWHGADDVATLLGFSAANQQAAGAAGVAATLTGSLAEPFALRPGVSLTLAVDGLLPASVRFGPDDFADITQATAAEIAAAINQALPEAIAQAAAGRLVIASETVGPQSLLQIMESPSSLVSLAGAPVGRLSTCTDSAGRIRLFYQTWETPTQQAAATAAPAAAPAAVISGNSALSRIRYKTLVDGAWRDAQPLYTQAITPQADPAAAVLPDGRVWTGWLDNPSTAQSTLRWALGAAAAPLPAVLLGRFAEPFSLRDGAVLTLTGNFPGTDRYTVHTADFADITRAGAAELAAAMNTQFTRSVAARQQNGAIGIASVATGAPARLAIDLSRSTTARAIGFDPSNAPGTPGSWSDLVVWSAPMDSVAIPPGRLAELTALADPAGIRIAWAAHRDATWRVQTAHWADEVLVATAGGAFVRAGGGAWTLLAGLPSPDIRAIAVDAAGTAWLATAAGVALRHADGSIAALAPAPASPDIRDLALGADGTAWIATAAGVAIRAPDGTLTLLDTAAGLPSDDVRALALAADGTLFIATAAGAAQRSADGTLTVFSQPPLPSNLVQGVAVDAAGTAYFATAAGLAVLAAGSISVVTASNGLAASDTRAVAVGTDGTLWVATARGVSVRAPSGAWTVIDTAAGLPSQDTRSLSLGPDGTVWVGTALGVSALAPGGTVGVVDLIGGGAANSAGRAVHAGWSAALDLATGGGGNREPVLAADASGKLWLAWSQRIGVGTSDDSWGLHGRLYDPASRAWGAELVLTAPPPAGRAADRTPALQPLPAAMRVYFASDRGGGSGLWSCDVSLAGIAGAPAALTSAGSSDLSPAPIGVGAATWVLYRGDANVSLAQAGSSPRSDALLGSVRVPDNGAVRRYAGSVATNLSDLSRLRTRRSFGDMLCYTPNRPDNVGTPADDELYTRGTVGLYVSSASPDATLDDAEVARLRELLQRFLPINLRTVVIVVEPADTELVFSGGIGDSYSDEYPFLSTVGTITDSAAAAMDGVSVLDSNVLGDVSANPADLATLRHRSYFPALQ